MVQVVQPGKRSIPAESEAGQGGTPAPIVKSAARNGDQDPRRRENHGPRSPPVGGACYVNVTRRRWLRSRMPRVGFLRRRFCLLPHREDGEG